MPYSSTIIQAAEETKARTVEVSSSGNSESPAYRSIAYREQLPAVEFMRKVYGGTRTMRLAGKDFLKPHPMESEQKWEDRRDIGVAYNAVKKTAGGLTGMVFRGDINYSDDMPLTIAGTETEPGDMNDIDLQGRAFPVFWASVAENALIDGHTWVHVDAPPNTASNPTEERAQNQRPYWINLKKEQVINWRYDMRQGRPVLTLIAYTESAVEPDGEFGERTRERIRVLRESDVAATDEAAALGNTSRRVVGEVWEHRERGEADGGGEDQRSVDRWIRVEFFVLDPRIEEIPVRAVYAERKGPFESEPPLQDLAYEQVEHYRVRSERQKALTFSAIAVPWAFGAKVVDEHSKPQVRWSSDGMLLLNDPDAKTGILESHGYGLEQLDQELDRCEKRMAKAGLQMLAGADGVQPTTATSDLIEKGEQDAWLARFAQDLEDAANECLVLHATYRGEPNAGSVQLSREFHDHLIDAATMRELGARVDAGTLSAETFFEELKHGRVLHVQHDYDEERARLEVEMDTRMGMAEAQLFGAEPEPSAVPA